MRVRPRILSIRSCCACASAAALGSLAVPVVRKSDGPAAMIQCCHCCLTSAWRAAGPVGCQRPSLGCMASGPASWPVWPPVLMPPAPGPTVQEFLATLRGNNQSWVPLLNPGVKVDPGEGQPGGSLRAVCGGSPLYSLLCSLGQPGATMGEAGGSVGTEWGQPGGSLGAAWGQNGGSLGAAWGHHGPLCRGLLCTGAAGRRGQLCTGAAVHRGCRAEGVLCTIAELRGHGRPTGWTALPYRPDDSP